MTLFQSPASCCLRLFSGFHTHGLQVLLCYVDLESVAYIPGTGLAQSHVSSNFPLFEEPPHANSLNDWTTLHHHRQHGSVPFFLRVFPVFVSIYVLSGSLTGVRLSVVSICISLMANGVHHFFSHLLTICTSFFEMCLTFY